MKPSRNAIPALTALLLAATLALLPACHRAPTPEELRNAAIDAIQLDDLPLLRLDDSGTFAPWQTSELRGAPYWLLVLDAADPVTLDALPEWSALATSLSDANAGRLVLLLTGSDADIDARLAAWPLSDDARRITFCRADDITLGALARRAPLRANPTAFLFSPDGALLRTTAGFPPSDHYLQDAIAASTGLPLPDHPAQGVLPEDNDP